MFVFSVDTHQDTETTEVGSTCQQAPITNPQPTWRPATGIDMPHRVEAQLIGIETESMSTTVETTTDDNRRPTHSSASAEMRKIKWKKQHI